MYDIQLQVRKYLKGINCFKAKIFILSKHLSKLNYNMQIENQDF